MANKVGISKYVISIGGSPVENNKYPAWINLYDKDNNRYVIRFYHSEKDLPADFKNEGTYYLNMPLVVFSNVVDILRNEQPVYLAVSDKRYYLVTDKEDVGL